MNHGLSTDRTGDETPAPKPISVSHGAPLDQPESVAQIVKRTFPAYQVDGGRVHLAGCTLEERLFVRIRCRMSGHVVDLYCDAEGEQVEPELIEALGLNTTRVLDGPPPGAVGTMARFLSQHINSLKDRLPAGAAVEFCSLVAVWCKLVRGKLRFSIGLESVELPFAGWARSFRPPPYVCPHTGQETFRLGITDDGRIAAGEQIIRCEETGRRVLIPETAICTATGKRVLKELLQRCPVSGDLLLSNALVRCEMCGELVSPQSIQGQARNCHRQSARPERAEPPSRIGFRFRKRRCAACRALRSVSKADPRMARVLHEHPHLDRWGGWRIAETATVYILTAIGWLKQLLVVVDKDTLDLRRVATGSRFWPQWDITPPEQYNFVLRQ